MLGLKLNRVGKKGHWGQWSNTIFYPGLYHGLFIDMDAQIPDNTRILMVLIKSSLLDFAISYHVELGLAFFSTVESGCSKIFSYCNKAMTEYDIHPLTLALWHQATITFPTA